MKRKKRRVYGERDRSFLTMRAVLVCLFVFTGLAFYGAVLGWWELPRVPVESESLRRLKRW